MQEIIFLLIISVFIGGMLWSDRDSRRARWYERGELSIAINHLRAVGYSAKQAVAAFEPLAKLNATFDIPIRRKFRCRS